MRETPWELPLQAPDRGGRNPQSIEGLPRDPVATELPWTIALGQGAEVLADGPRSQRDTLSHK